LRGGGWQKHRNKSQILKCPRPVLKNFFFRKNKHLRRAEPRFNVVYTNIYAYPAYVYAHWSTRDAFQYVLTIIFLCAACPLIYYHYPIPLNHEQNQNPIQQS